MSLTSVLGFVAASVALKTKSPEIYGPPAPPKPPEFRARWWYAHNRLDARPVIWSLQNHPEEWQWDGDRRGNTMTIRGYITHKPSGHQFWVNGWWSKMGRARCDCESTRGLFHSFQPATFARAVHKWRAAQYDPGHFAAHFLPKAA